MGYIELMQLIIVIKNTFLQNCKNEYALSNQKKKNVATDYKQNY